MFCRQEETLETKYQICYHFKIYNILHHTANPFSIAHQIFVCKWFLILISTNIFLLFVLICLPTSGNLTCFLCISQEVNHKINIKCSTLDYWRFKSESLNFIDLKSIDLIELTLNNIMHDSEAAIQRCSENMQQIYRKHPCRSAISIKLLCNFVEITLRHGCSP